MIFGSGARKLRFKHDSYRTEQSYIDWIKCFFFLHNKQHTDVMGEKEIEMFLTYLAVGRNVAASTQYKETVSCNMQLLPKFAGQI